MQPYATATSCRQHVLQGECKRLRLLLLPFQETVRPPPEGSAESQRARSRFGESSSRNGILRLLLPNVPARLLGTRAEMPNGDEHNVEPVEAVRPVAIPRALRQ
jgi:hypothetical protein